MVHHPALRLLGGCLAITLSTSLASPAEHDPIEVLKRVTAKVVAAGKVIPNYTCVETVNRDFYRPAPANRPRACPVLLEQRQHPTKDPGLRLLSTDRLRLDVAMVQRGEIFSWVGASKFDDADVGHLVREGPIGSGAFGAFLSVVFQQDQAQFAFEKNTVADGRSLLEYSFQVRREDSHYKIKTKDDLWIYTAYGGRFLVDPETEDVVRMSVQTAELPPATNQCMLETDMDFGIAQIGDAPVLLPTHARQRFVYQDGEETENTTTFANCREYRGESTITFEGEPAAAAPGKAGSAPARPASVPAGLPFTLELTAPIPAGTAAAGDSFFCRLVSPLRDGKQKVLARAGSVVEGRLLRVQTYHLSPAEVIVVLKPESLEIGGSKVPLTAVRDYTREVVAARSRARRSAPILIPRPGEEHAGLFRFSGTDVVIRKGLRSDWRSQ